jgi:endoglucanase
MAASVLGGVVVAIGAGASAGHSFSASTQFFAPGPEGGALKQISATKNPTDRALLRGMEAKARAVWITQGTPQKTRANVQKAVGAADEAGQVAVLVAYNIPGRDCGGLSAGGATNLAAYGAWIDSFAAGIGDSHAVVILEPDSLGLLPSSCGEEPTFTDVDRYAELNSAVDRLEAQPNTSVYLDGTHSAWLNVADNARRLVAAGVQRAQGFFLNVSNFQFTPNSVQYGTWVSDCIAYATVVNPGDYGCPDQYWNGGPHPAMIADLLGEWTGVALSSYGVWSDSTAQPNLNTSGESLRYASMLGSTVPTTQFVVDTSRNGLGPWNPATSSHSYSDAQDWCNPPGRGLGALSTANTGVPLLDAYLWVKTPGESDGSCARGLGPAGSTVDPEWGQIDPAAGEWFAAQALQLAQLASPPSG